MANKLLMWEVHEDFSFLSEEDAESYIENCLYNYSNAPIYVGHYATITTEDNVTTEVGPFNTYLEALTAAVATILSK